MFRRAIKQLRMLVFLLCAAWLFPIASTTQLFQCVAHGDSCPCPLMCMAKKAEVKPTASASTDACHSGGHHPMGHHSKVEGETPATPDQAGCFLKRGCRSEKVQAMFHSHPYLPETVFTFLHIPALARTLPPCTLDSGEGYLLTPFHPPKA